MHKKLFSQSGFTLLEIIIVIIIIGVIAGLGFPSFQYKVRKIANQEAIGILMTIFEQNSDYSYRHPTNLYTADITDFDVTFPTPKSFEAPVAIAGSNIICKAFGYEMLGSIEYIGDNGYTLYVRKDTGIIDCCPTVATDHVCERMNIPIDVGF